MGKVETEIYYTRPILGSRVKVERDGPFKKISIEHPTLLASQAVGRTLKRAGKNTIELAKEFPWRNRAVQITGVILLGYLAYKNQPTEVPTAQGDLSTRPQKTPQPPVEAPAIPEEAAVNQPLSYIVNRGDTLFSLAQRLGTTVEAIVKANNIENPSLIHAGQELVIPGKLTPENPNRTIVGKQEIRRLTEKEMNFINWLNSSHLKWRSWSGYERTIFVPYWIYQLAKTAEEASDGRCPWYITVAIGLTETGQWDWEALSEASAKGVMQFMPGTFPIYATHEGADRDDPIDNIMAAANMIIRIRLPEAKNQEEYIKYFATEKPVWNRYRDQAENSWELLNELKTYEQTFDETYGQTINE